MKRLYLFLGKRLLFVIPQLFGITLVSFLFLQLIPGDPAVLMAGPFATPSVLENLRISISRERDKCLMMKGNTWIKMRFI